MERRTLADVLATVDATVLRLAAGPADAGDRAVGDVVILDWTDPHALRPGTLVLAVGVEPDRPAAATLIERAGAAGAAAVIVRSDGELAGTLGAAVDRAGIALLTAPLGVAWGQLYALLRTALASAGNGGQGGAEGVLVGDLFALADAIATALRAPVTIEDPQWRVLAYSNLDQEIDAPRRDTILGRTPPPEWQARLDAAGVGRALRRGDGVVRFEHEGLIPRRAAPVRAGGEMLGSIWVATAGDAPPDIDQQLLRAADLAAMHLVAHRVSEDLKRRARGVSVRDLLDGVAATGRRGSAVPLGVVAFDIPSDDGRAWLASGERVLSVVSLFCEAAHREAMCALVDDRIWALVPAPPDRLQAMAESVVDRVRGVLGLPLVAIVGPASASVRDVPRAREVVERGFAVLERRPAAGTVVDVESLRAATILHELLELAGDRRGLRRGPLEEILDAGGSRNAGQLGALRAYLDAHGDVAAAADRLDVHPNTLRYRLRRLLEVTGLDLGDPDERLVTELQLRMLDDDRTSG